MSFGRNRLTHGGRPRRDPSAARALLLVALLACASATAASEPQTTPQRPGSTEAAPPPMRYLPAETRSRLDAARDIKARTRLSMELAEARLVSAAAHLEADRFDAATLEFGVYAAIIRDAVDYVRQNDKSRGRISGKTRDLLKRIELALRSHVPRLETLRRSLPSQHAVHAQTTLDFVRDTRAEVLDAFFDNMVVPSRTAPNTQPSANERARGATPPAEQKKPTDQR